MKIGYRSLFILLVTLGIGLGIGYYFGYDRAYYDWNEMRVNKSSSITISCEEIAEAKARDDLKPKYGDALTRDFVLGSPHYTERYNNCLSNN